jgi:K+-sensing histidine kinase KdpD
LITLGYNSCEFPKIPDNSVGLGFATHGFMFRAQQPDDSSISKDMEEKSEFEQAYDKVLKARDELLEGLAHDLKNALSSIVMNTSLARRVVPKKSEESAPNELPDQLSEKDRCVLQMFERIEEASDRIRMAMQDAIDMTGCVSGSLVIQPARREVKILLGDALAQVEAQKKAKSIHVHLSGVQEGMSVIADHEKVPTALARLIAFGMKISPASSQIEIQVEERGEEVLFRMLLTSEIATASQLQHVFDRQGKKPGLYLVRGIAEAFGGQVWATSRANGGVELGMSLKCVERDSKIRLLVQS